MAASSPYESAAATVRAPASSQAASSQPGDPVSRATSAETRKMPDPIIDPATMVVASKSPRLPRLSCGDVPSSSIGGRRAAERAVALAVEDVDGQADGEPHEEADPRDERQRQHEAAAQEDPEKREDGHERAAEGPRPIGGHAAEHEDPAAHEDEGEEGPDVGEIRGPADVGEE